MGLSPHAWGNLSDGNATELGLRSIPTRVGEPKYGSTYADPYGVYPHTRGGTICVEYLVAVICGLSPHAWGNLLTAPRPPSLARSIPTRVGEPLYLPRPVLSRQVYPHTRGGTRFGAHVRLYDEGLSPHAWGNLLIAEYILDTYRSIPTRVGEPRRASPKPQKTRVYPHTRGGTRPAYVSVGQGRGLSPHAWGNLFTSRTPSGSLGSIPTRVGEPTPTTVITGDDRVYPHTRGGTIWRKSGTSYQAGLSPHAWGNPSRLRTHRNPVWSIPTRVGEPQIEIVIGGQRAVYPHTRGGTSGLQGKAASAHGLSPHAWGNRRVADCVCILSRSIPTRVGEPSARRGL